MADPRWRRLRDLFDRAVELPADAQARLLREECGDDVELRAELESLIAGNEAADGVLPRIVGAAAQELAGEEGPRLPETVGPYRVLELLGHGGMGAVYRAERDDGAFRGSVAIKVLRAGPADPSLVTRFRTERQILADLRHPNIARLLDGGATDHGAPYLVMEYVEGERIDRYCDRRELGVAQRIELVRAVCSAVQAAHRALVVHRDLKPANILVTPDGTPKLLDFGIAKLLGPETHPHTVAVTGTLDRLLTPAYASPEQVLGQPITTSSDVYSLGVVLYELLAGVSPHPFGTMSGTEIERVVCRTEPDRPSAAVRRRIGSDEGSAAAAARSTTGDRLARRLTGDLDTILLAALRKEPERRYPSVEAFSEDLRRHLEGLPVVARRDTVAYRAGKFVRRHAAAVAATAAAFVVVLGFGVHSAIQADRAGRERDRAVAAEERARLEAERSSNVTSFLVDLFRVADPAESRGEEVTAREILDRGAARIRRELDGQPEVEAALLETIGEVYRNLGLFDAAREMLVASLELRRGAAPDAAREADLLVDLASIHLERAELDEAGRLADAALAASVAVHGRRHPATARALTALADRDTLLGRLESAIERHEEALAIRRELLGRSSPEAAASLMQLAELESIVGRDADADARFEEVLQVLRADGGEDHPDVLGALTSYIGVIQDRDPGRALELGAEALGLARRLYPEPHPDLAHVLAIHARSLRKVGRPGDAVDFARQAVECERAVRGDAHPFVGWARFQVGAALLAAGRRGEAEAELWRALEVYRAAFREPEGQTAGVLARLGRMAYEDGRTEEAEALLRESYDIYRRELPADHELVIELRAGAGLAAAALGRDDAAELLRGALPRLAENRGDDAPFVAEVRRALAELDAAAAVEAREGGDLTRVLVTAR